MFCKFLLNYNTFYKQIITVQFILAMIFFYYLDLLLGYHFIFRKKVFE